MTTVKFNHEHVNHEDHFPHLDFDWNAMEQVIREFYSHLDKPIYITTCKMIKKYAGTYRPMWKQRKDNRWGTKQKNYKGMDKEFLEATKTSGAYHRVKLAEKFMGDIEDITFRENQTYELEKFYHPDLINNFTFECYILHVIAHELQHAIQKDDTSKGERFFEHAKRAKTEKFQSAYYSSSMIERDAEVGARHYGPQLVRRYFEITGNELYKKIKVNWEMEVAA